MLNERYKFFSDVQCMPPENGTRVLLVNSSRNRTSC